MELQRSPPVRRLSYRRPVRDPLEGPLEERTLGRRDFIKVAGGSLLASAAFLACDDEEGGDGLPPEARRSVFLREDFDGAPEGWGRAWLNVRYEGAWSAAAGAGVLELPEPTPKAVGEKGKVVAAYMARPVLWTEHEAADAEVQVRVTIEGPAEAGVVVRAGFDEAYALLVGNGRASLFRYGRTDRDELASEPFDQAEDVRLTLAVSEGRVSGLVEPGDGPGRGVQLDASDPDPLGSGMVGVLANPLGPGGAQVRYRAFRAASVEEPEARGSQILYAFTGGIVRDGDGYAARVTARTVVPEDIEFIRSDSPRLVQGRTEGRLGSVHGWLRDLAPDTEYRWAAIPVSDRRRSDYVTFRTPPAPGDAVRFAYASCTSGRVREYPSFVRAAEAEPMFYLHAGDWGYADVTGVNHSADQYQARWVRMLRSPEVEQLTRTTPLMFWQDDHDYHADNGWAETIDPFTVTAFDELHANPGREYFDLRWGDVHVWCLDCRLHATDPDAPDGPGKSRLGAEQKRWLMGGMSASDAPVLVVASPMVFRNKVPEDPGWHNTYAHERDELLRFFSELGATVVILSGDSHGQRLIHHFEFGELYEFNSSGTDFPGGGQGNNDPEHTLVNADGRSGFALVELGPAGPERAVTVRVLATDDGSALFERSLPVRG